MNLKHLTDKTLLFDTKNLASQYRSITTQLLHHLREIDARKLYSELGYSTLFNYVVQELGFSEASASRRISAMKLLKEIPELEEKIESGVLNLSHIDKASQAFRKEGIENKELKIDILKTIENTSTRTCEKALSEIVSPLRLNTEVRFTQYLTFNLSFQTFNKWEDARALLANQKLSKEEILDKILSIATKKLETKRFHLNNTKETTSKNPRYITAAVKKAVYLRDKVCQKCGTKYGLQYDHRKPYALGGKSTKENVRLLCRNCNQRARISSNLHFP